MSIRRSRTNEDHLSPHQRRRAIILLLAVALARMAGGETPPTESAESSRRSLGTSAPTRPCVPTG